MTVRKEDPDGNSRRLAAAAWIGLAAALVVCCIVVPQLYDPALLPQATISVGFLWLVSPLVAVAAGKGLAALSGEPAAPLIFKALAVALFLDCLMIGVFLTGHF